MDHGDPPQAQVVLAAGFAARVASFAHAEVAAQRTPREDFASATAAAGTGSGEFAGRRRYRPGDDVRGLDWEALARGAGTWIRLRERDSGEKWCIVLDASASMAVGAPAKLQLAAELALALAAVALARGHAVALATPRGVLDLRASSEWPRALGEVDGLAARGSGALDAWLAHPSLGRASRWILVGDLVDLEPARLGALQRRGKRVDAAAVLAPIELAPPAGGTALWLDPERGERWSVHLGEAELAAYAGLLSAHLEHWRAFLARGGGRLVVAAAGDAFEPHARRLLAERAR